MLSSVFEHSLVLPSPYLRLLPTSLITALHFHLSCDVCFPSLCFGEFFDGHRLQQPAIIRVLQQVYAVDSATHVLKVLHYIYPRELALQGVLE